MEYLWRMNKHHTMDDVDKGGGTTQSEVEDLPPRLGEDEFYRALASFQRRRLL